ncbi:MAG: hypothetical protein Q4A61_07285, partial [Porphyromonadaceae bacterium]|nr:hypothetical protein [Porphyromonadaceae bacterium]
FPNFFLGVPELFGKSSGSFFQKFPKIFRANQNASQQTQKQLIKKPKGNTQNRPMARSLRS